jgi:hypothetical protein
MPAATELQIARWRASSFVLPQSPSSDPLPPRLMFATLTFSRDALAVTQSMPHATDDHDPEPALFNTRTE